MHTATSTSERQRRHDQNNREQALLLAREILADPKSTDEDRAVARQVLDRSK